MTTQEMLDQALLETNPKKRLSAVKTAQRILIIRFSAMTLLYVTASVMTVYYYDLHLLGIFLVFAWGNNLEKTFRK